MIDSLKALQDVLGRHQDREVQIAMLRSLADEVATLPRGPRAVMAMGVLVERLRATSAPHGPSSPSASRRSPAATSDVSSTKRSVNAHADASGSRSCASTARAPRSDDRGAPGGAGEYASPMPSEIRIASYLADPAEVHRVLLLYSGGLDTSVMLKWIQDEYEAEVVALTVNLGQPGEDYETVKGKALQIGAVEAHVIDAREEFAREYVLPAIKANAIYGLGYPLFTALGRPLIAKLAVEYARGTRLRHDRPRMHRQGQRPGPDRGDDRDTCARAEGDRAGPLVADGPRRGGRVRARARDPGQRRRRGRAVFDRRQPLGALERGPLDRGSRARARGRRVPARHATRAGARRARDRRGRVRARRAGRARTASGWSRSR